MNTHPKDWNEAAAWFKAGELEETSMLPPRAEGWKSCVALHVEKDAELTWFRRKPQPVKPLELWIGVRTQNDSPDYPYFLTHGAVSKDAAVKVGFHTDGFELKHFREVIELLELARSEKVQIMRRAYEHAYPADRYNEAFEFFHVAFFDAWFEALKKIGRAQ